MVYFTFKLISFFLPFHSFEEKKNFNPPVAAYLANSWIDYGHERACDAHSLSWNIYHFNEQPIKITDLIFSIFRGASGFFDSLKYSLLGNCCMHFMGQKYRCEKIGSSFIDIKQKKKIKALTYNVGFLPGELAQEFTVGKFPISQKKRCEKICEFLTQELKKTDILFLEETQDPLFLDSLIRLLNKEKISCFIYHHMGEPLKPGISSGLMIVSRFEILDLKVQNLQNCQPFFQRVFVWFQLSDDLIIVHTHLTSDPNPLFRKQQLNQILRFFYSFNPAILIGDLNFKDHEQKFSWVSIESFKNSIHEPTLLNPYKDENFPDFIGVIGAKDKRLNYVKVKKEIKYSDHYPISLEINI